MKKLHFLSFIVLGLLFIVSLPIKARPVIQVEGYFKKIANKPSWLIILRNLNNGSVVPWLYDFTSTYSHWNLFPESHEYQILLSQLSFSNSQTNIENFCNIQNASLSGKSLRIVLSGDLIPPGTGIRCYANAFPAN